MSLTKDELSMDLDDLILKMSNKKKEARVKIQLLAEEAISKQISKVHISWFIYKQTLDCPLYWIEEFLDEKEIPYVPFLR